MWLIAFLALFGEVLLFAGLSIREDYFGWALFLIASGYIIFMGSMVLMFKENNSIERRK